MAKHIKLVIGKIRDNDDENAPSDHLSKKVYDVVNTATVVHSVAVAKIGSAWAAALVVYE